MKTKFTCKACNACVKVKLPVAARSAMDLAMYANHAGMLGIVDAKRGRVLVYCNRACATPRRKKRAGDGANRRASGAPPESTEPV